MSLGTAIRFRGRTRFSRRRFPRLVLALTLTGVLILVLSAFGASILQVYRLEREAARLARIRHGLHEQNAVLREEIRLLHTPAYIERIAREQLGLVKPGEIAVLIVRPPADRPSGPAGVTNSPPAAHPLQRQAPGEPSWTARLKELIVKILQ